MVGLIFTPCFTNFAWISGTSEQHHFLSLGPRWIDSLADDTDKRDQANTFLTTLFPRYILGNSSLDSGAFNFYKKLTFKR